jgi:hypothetical protein
MVKEVKDQVDNKNFTVVRQDSVLVDKPVMPTVANEAEEGYNHLTGEEVEGKIEY